MTKSALQSPRPLLVALDPSLTDTGYAVLDPDTRDVVATGTVHTRPRTDTGTRLLALGRQLETLIRRHRPAALAIERPFVGPNRTTALTLGAVRGVILYLCAKAGLPAHEYSTGHVKETLTGRPTGSKTQVAHMVQALTGHRPATHHESDAIAVGLAHLAAAGHQKLRNAT